MSAVLVLAAVLALHMFVAADAVAPVWLDDEIGYLANAHYLAGIGEPMDIGAIGYYSGWSMVLVPLWWLLDDPGAIYRAAVGLSVACGVLLVFPLAALARRAGLSASWSFVAAGIVAVAPARTALSGYALAENFLALVVAMAAILAWRFVDRPTTTRAILLGLDVAYVFFTHGRVVPLVVATLLLFAATARRSMRASVVGALTCGGASVLGYVVNDRIAAAVYDAVMDREGAAFGALLAVDPAAAATALIGQSWYQLAAWAGLPLIGVVLLVGRARAELVERRPGVAAWGLLSLLGVLAISLTSVASAIARGSERVDIYIYGRYVEPIAVALAIIGLARLMAGLRRPHAILSVGLAVAASVLLVTIVVPQVPAGSMPPINVPGLMAWPWPGVEGLPSLNQPWLQTTLAGSGLMAAALLLRRSRVAVAMTLAAAGVSATVLAQIGPLHTFDGSWHTQAHALVRSIDILGLENISYDLSGSSAVGRNGYQFKLAQHSVEEFASETDRPPTDVVLSRETWPQGEEWGARRVAGDPSFDEALWIMPGALQDRLADAGALETEPVSAALPDEARNFSVELDSSTQGQVVTVDRNDPPTIDMTLTHEGGGATWAALGTTAEPTGVVRVLLFWQHAGGVSGQLAELPRSLIPGASATLSVELAPPDGVPDGRSQVRVGLIQEGYGEIARAGAPPISFAVDVQR